jgi:tetratricopeptide (TPR) repeat protein
MNNPEMALEYGRKVVKNRIDLNDSVGLAIAYTNLGNIYEDLEKYEIAFNYYKDATFIDSVFQNERDLSIDYNNLGYMFEQLKDYNKALEYYSKSYEIDQKLEDVYNQGIVLINIARINFQLNNISQANELALKGLSLAKQSGSIRSISEAYKLLSEIETARNNSESSFEYFKLYAEIEDSLREQINVISNENLNATPKDIAEEKRPKVGIGQGGISDMLFYALAIVLFSTVVYLLVRLFKTN